MDAYGGLPVRSRFLWRRALKHARIALGAQPEQQPRGCRYPEFAYRLIDGGELISVLGVAELNHKRHL